MPKNWTEPNFSNPTYYKRGIIMWVVKEMGRSMMVMKYTTMDIFNESLDDNR
jgi:hypothetical protein